MNTAETQLSPEAQIGQLLRGNETTNREEFTEREDVTTDANDAPDPQIEGGTEPEPEPEPAQEPEPESAAPDDDSAPESEPEPDVAFDLTAMAEKMGVEISELYDIEIPLGGEREPITLGQFKDHVQELFTVEERQTALEGQKIEHENAVIRDQQELLAMINESGVELSPQLRQRANEAAQHHAQQQRELLFTSLPTWRDQAVYQNDRAEMVETLNGVYGISEAQIGSTTEAVLIKMMHDLTRFHRMFGEADANAKRIPKVPRRPGKKRRQVAKAEQDKTNIINQGATSKDPYDKARAVSSLLGPKR